MTIYNKIIIDGTTYKDAKNVTLDKEIGDTNSTSNFEIIFDNPVGRRSTDFNLNDKVQIYADTSDPPTNLIFTGIIEDIQFFGMAEKESVRISGRDYGAVLQDIMVLPRIFKNKEIAEIIHAIMAANVDTSLVTTGNVDTTGTVLDKITFNNISVFDALRELSDLSGYYFFVDENQDLNFKQRESTSSGETFDETNVKKGSFRISDVDLFNDVTVFGDRILTGAREIFTTGVDNTGSVYGLTDKPSNVSVQLSGATNTFLQPGGIVNFNDPANENVKYLVNYQGKAVVLTSGTTAGDNTVPNGSIIIIDYQRSTPLVRTKQDTASIGSYGPKHKIIVDRNQKLKGI